MFWPGMNGQITEMVNAFATRTKHRPKHASEPLNSHPVTNFPREKIGVDLCVYNGVNDLVICDYYSKYPKECRLQSLSSQSVINVMKYVFSSRGIPEICSVIINCSFHQETLENLRDPMISSIGRLVRYILYIRSQMG